MSVSCVEPTSSKELLAKPLTAAWINARYSFYSTGSITNGQVNHLAGCPAKAASAAPAALAAAESGSTFQGPHCRRRLIVFPSQSPVCSTVGAPWWAPGRAFAPASCPRPGRKFALLGPGQRSRPNRLQPRMAFSGPAGSGPCPPPLRDSGS